MEDDPLFKLGAYPNQRSDGLYLDGVLVELIEIFARQIVRDNQFLGLCASSTFGVRTGKSTLMQQFAYYYTYAINKMHGLNIKFDHTNIVFNTEDLEKKAFKLPKYSCIILDEGEGLDEHAMSKTIKSLQRFLRISGQLNLLILVIMPDFFDIPKFLAMNRSNFLIDVKFENEFERGFFEYYNFTDKKLLYVKGKKYHDYSVQKATLQNGRFVPMYCVDEEKYRKMKHDDMVKRDTTIEETRVVSAADWKKVVTEIIARLYPFLKERYKVDQMALAQGLGIPYKTLKNWYSDYRKIMQSDLGLKSSIDIREPSPPDRGLNDTISLTEDVGDGGDFSDDEDYIDGDEDNDNDDEGRTPTPTIKPKPKPDLPPESRRTDLKNGVTIFSYD